MALTPEQVDACNARLDVANGLLTEIEDLLRESGRLGSIDGQTLSAIQEIRGVVADLVNAPA